MTNTSMRQVTGIILLAAGLGWAGGNFTPANSPLWNYLLHTIPFLLVLVLSLGFFGVFNAPQHEGSHSSWAKIGLSIFACFSSTGLIIGIVLGATNPDPNAYGIKTLADWVPTVIVILGGLVWLTTLLPTRRSNAETRTANI